MLSTDPLGKGDIESQRASYLMVSLDPFLASGAL